MYLLKCSNCNNMIEVRTEFLMLCPKCKHKLTNNFQDWRKERGNSGKNFQDYLGEVCISSEDLAEQQKQEMLQKKYSPEKNKQRKIINITVAVIALIASIAISLCYFNILSEYWMETAIIVMNIVIGLIVSGLAVMMTLKRKRYQTYVPALISLAGVALAGVADILFIILTDNL